MRSTILLLACLLLAGCPRQQPAPPAGDGGSRDDAAPADDAGAYDPSVGNPFEGALSLDDGRVRAVDPGAFPVASPACRAPLLARVSSVADGDTVRVSGVSESLNELVRLIGVDTPELARDGAPADCWAEQARLFTEQLRDRTVWITFDADCIDRFGRLLGYLWVGEGPQDLWSRQLLRRGHGSLLIISPNDHFRDVFSQDEFLARRDALGLWGSCR